MASVATTQPRMSNISLFALWFGAAVSAAELQAGGSLVGMAWPWAAAAIVLGHLLGALIMYLAAKISWEKDLLAMAALQLSLGKVGMRLAAGCNVLQLIGWTVVMIVLASNSLEQLAGAMNLPIAESSWFKPAVRLAMGGLLIVWTLFGFYGRVRINTYTVVLLFGLTIVAAVAALGGPTGAVTGHESAALGFGAAFDLALIMPLSWMPLIGDYTRPSVAGSRSALLAALGYGAGSVWMYLIGFAGASVTGDYDPALQMVKLGLGLAALAIVVLATVTTGFLDLYSAAQSTVSLWSRAKPRQAALIMGGLATVAAVWFPMDKYVDFLYWIGSIFAPLYGLVIADFFAKRWFRCLARLRPPDWPGRRRAVFMANLIVWAIGWLIYRFVFGNDSVLGSTLPTMLITFVLQIIVSRGVLLWKKP